MAIAQNGILGFATGRVGPVTCYVRNGRNIIRTARNTGVVKATEARLAQRDRIRLCIGFAKVFSGTGFFNATFPAYGHGGTGYNRAVSSLMNVGLTGSYPHQRLAYENVLVARGPLPGAKNAAAIADTTGNILFHWTDNSEDGTARPGDDCILVAYATNSNRPLFSLLAGSRSAQTAMLNATALSGETVATWMAFRNAQGDVSDSVFTGWVTL